MTNAARFASFKNRAVSLGAAGAVLQLALTLPLARVLNVWQDDAYTLHSTQGSVAYAFHEAVGFEQNAPLYFVLIDLWRHTDHGAFFARLFSVICAAAVVALTPQLAARYVPAIDPRALVLAAALNPFLIWTALEIRVYALIVLVSLLLLLFFYDGFLEDEPNTGARWWYALTVCVALYTQYYLAFLVLAQALVLLTMRRSAFPQFAVSAAGGVFPFLPMAALVPGQMKNFKGGFLAPTLPGSLVNLSAILSHYVLPIDFLGHRKIVYSLAVLGALLALFALRSSFGRRGDLTIAAIGALAGALLVVGTYVEGVHVLTRHAALILVPAIFTPFCVLSFLQEPQRRRAATVWLCAITFAAAGTLFVTYRSGAKAGDWARVSQYVMRNERPGQPILVFQAENALPFAYYYRGPNRVVPVPRGVDFRTYNVDDFVVRNEGEIARLIPPGASRIWFIRAGECYSANIQFGCGVVERYLAQRFRVVSARAFYRSDVRLLERAGPTR